MASVGNNTTTETSIHDTELTRLIKFSVFVGLEPLAVINNFILVYYLIADRVLRHTLQYHAFLGLLIVTLLTNLIEIPRVIYYLHIGIVIPQTYTNCLIWLWCDYVLFNFVNFMIFWISLERYLLIFHPTIYATAKSRLFFHYLPITVNMVYVLMFFTGAIFFYPCEQKFDYHVVLCGIACYTNYANIALYDFVAHALVPLSLGICIDTTLIIRTIYRKRVGLQQSRAQWRKNRKMILQLLLIASLYLLCQGPAAGIVFLQLFITYPDSVIYVQNVYFYYLFWLFTLLSPFACMGCMPEVIKKVKNSIKWPRRITAVRPVTPNQVQTRRQIILD